MLNYNCLYQLCSVELLLLFVLASIVDRPAGLRRPADADWLYCRPPETAAHEMTFIIAIHLGVRSSGRPF